MSFKIGDKVVAQTKMRTAIGKAYVAGLEGIKMEPCEENDGIMLTVDAEPGMVGTIIETNVYGDPDYYTADFHESGGLITDCHALEIACVN